MKQVLLALLFLPLGITAYDPAENRPPSDLLTGASNSTRNHRILQSGSFRLHRSAFRQRTTGERGRTRRRRMLLIRAMVLATNQLEAARSQGLHTQSQQQESQD